MHVAALADQQADEAELVGARALAGAAEGEERVGAAPRLLPRGGRAAG